MEPKKHKKDNSFTVMVVSDSSEGGIRQFMLGSKHVTILLVVLVAVLMVCAGYAAYSHYTIQDLNKRNQDLTNRNKELTEFQAGLETQNTELSDKVAILSSTINKKVEKEAVEAEKYLPTGFPLAGTATVEEETLADEQGRPIVIFAAPAGTGVVASGNGTVEAIEADEVYGTRLILNHNNGYQTIYRNSSPCKVKTGDEVSRGILLFEMTTQNEKLGYQIMNEGEYTDPLDIMEIYG